MRFAPICFISFLSLVIAKPLGDFSSQSYPNLLDNILAPNGDENTISANEPSDGIDANPSADMFSLAGIGAPAIPNILTYLPGGYRAPTVPDTIGSTSGGLLSPTVEKPLDSDWTTDGTLVAQKQQVITYEAIKDQQNESTYSGEGPTPCQDQDLACCDLTYSQVIDNLSQIVRTQCKECMSPSSRS